MVETHSAVQSSALQAAVPKDLPESSSFPAAPDNRKRRVMLTGAWDFLSQAIHRRISGTQTGLDVYPVTLDHGYDVRNPVEALQAVMLIAPDVIVHVQRPRNAFSSMQLFDILESGMSVVRAAALSRARLILVQCRHDAACTAALDSISTLAGAHPDLDFSTLRLPHLMGPGNNDSNDILQQICEVVYRGHQMGVSDWFFPSDGNGEISRLHVDDVARLVEMEAHSPRALEARTLKVSPAKVSIGKFIGQALKSLGHPGEWKPSSGDLSWNVRDPIGEVADLLPGWTPSEPTPEQVALMVAARGIQLSRSAPSGG